MSEPLYKVKAEFFKTLGHPARIRILELLVAGDKSVAQLLPEVGLESSNLSQQLGVLRRAGVVDAQRDGNTMIYSTASPDIAELLTVARKVLTGVLSDRVALLGRGIAIIEQIDGKDAVVIVGPKHLLRIPRHKIVLNQHNRRWEYAGHQFSPTT